MGHGRRITDSPHHSSKLCEGHLKKIMWHSIYILILPSSILQKEHSDNVWLKIIDGINLCGLTFGDALQLIFLHASLINFLASIIGDGIAYKHVWNVVSD